MELLKHLRAVQTTHRSDPPRQIDWTQTVCRPIRLLRWSAAGPYFPKPILADWVRVSSSNTRATRSDCHINGFKGLKFVNQPHSSPYFPKSTSHSQFLLSLSPMLPFADPTTDVYPSLILLVVDLCLTIVDLCLFVVDLCSSSSTFTLRPQRPSLSSPPSLRFDLSISSLRFGYLWICGSALWVFVLWICRSFLWVLEIFQGIIPIEDMREFFWYKTLDTKEAHSSLSEKPY